MAEVLIVLIIFGAIFGRGLLRSFYSHREKMRAIELHNSSADSKRENSELLEKLDKLSERVEVLEKIITDEKYHLDRKIANL
ncbi:nitrite reductase [Vibrio sp. SCSIO 43140]|uniref:nitrite reductase n=1 Tax=Vibrio sp. SCSIO 43140 TaxID=2819100 RepID=UPI0020755554|nr:nitrite reductase [Vibrio sp. SCSIO 43140]USD62370.1 nitrite reductase [Vibrio sp. SCSIO 43140]